MFLQQNTKSPRPFEVYTCGIVSQAPLAAANESHKACGQIDSHGWRAAGGGTNALSAGVSNAAGWGLETILTMALVFTVFAATDAERASDTAHLPVRPVCCC